MPCRSIRPSEPFSAYQTGVPDWYAEKGSEGLIDLQGIADAYLYLYQQHRNAWTHELDLRTHLENF